LIGNPFVTVPQLAKSLELTRQGAQHVISTLERAAVVKAVAGDHRPALFVATEVLDVLQRDE
jgi:ribosomal protein S25